MRTIAVAAILFAALALWGNAAQAAPWCAHYSTGFNDCSFHSYRQCMAALSASADFASEMNSKIQIGMAGTREGPIGATIQRGRVGLLARRLAAASIGFRGLVGWRQRPAQPGKLPDGVDVIELEMPIFPEGIDIIGFSPNENSLGSGSDGSHIAL